MWESYADIVRQYPKVSLAEERRLISKAQKGSKKSKDEIVLRHIGFLIFRIRKIIFPALIRRFWEDLLEEAILITYKKIETYDLLITAIKKEILILLNLSLIFGSA